LRSKGDPSAYAPARVDALVEQVDRQVNRLVRLVDDMLDISRIQSGRLRINQSAVDVPKLVAEAVQDTREQFGPERTSDLRQGPTAPARVRADAARLHQVFTGLLANAIRFGEGRPVVIESAVSGDVVTITVRDEGRGIPQDKVEKIFERYGSTISPNEGSGLGLGLFIARQIVASHGGRIWVESEAGQGATFRVALPLAAD
jgi:signal transduction histidine kinase